MVHFCRYGAARLRCVIRMNQTPPRHWKPPSPNVCELEHRQPHAQNLGQNGSHLSLGWLKSPAQTIACTPEPDPTQELLVPPPPALPQQAAPHTSTASTSSMPPLQLPAKETTHHHRPCQRQCCSSSILVQLMVQSQSLTEFAISFGS